MIPSSEAGRLPAVYTGNRSVATAEGRRRSAASADREYNVASMACPFFVPIERFETSLWPHPVRLPLGDLWRGQCGAPGHEGEQPTEEELQNSCNLGYARCPRLPQGRHCDAVRFGLALERTTRLRVQYVLEAQHGPAGHGELEFDLSGHDCVAPHPDPLLQRMAECFVASYLRQQGKPADL